MLFKVYHCKKPQLQIPFSFCFKIQPDILYGCGMLTEHFILSFYPFFRMILSGFQVYESQMSCCIINEFSSLVPILNINILTPSFHHVFSFSLHSLSPYSRTQMKIFVFSNIGKHWSYIWTAQTFYDEIEIKFYSS